MEAKGILFLLQTHKPWDLSKEGDYNIFYDPLQMRVILHQLSHVYAFEIYDKAKDSNPVYFSLPVTYKLIQALAISRNDQYMVIQDTPLHMNFIYFGSPTLDTKRELAQMRQTNIAFSSDRAKILGVSFVQSPAVDLIVCHCKGLELYKYKKNLENIKSISYKSLGAWISPLEGIIILSSASVKGEMQTFHLKKDEAKGKNIKGPVFNLALRQADGSNTPKSEKKKKDETAQQFYCEIPQTITKNIHLYNEELKALEKKKEDNYQIHKMLFGKLYSKNTFLHYNQVQGIIHMYRLTSDSVERSASVLTLDPSISYEMQIADNLILISNKNTSLFSIYDTKSMYKLKRPLFQNGKVDLSYSRLYFCNNLEESEKAKKTKTESYLILEPLIQIEDLAEDSEENIDTYTNAYVEMKYNLINDLADRQPSQYSSSAEASPKAKLPEFTINDYVSLDTNITYNVRTKQFFIYIFNKKGYYRKVSKKVPGLINLMRRGNPKAIILSSIKQLMETGISLHKLSKLFANISTVYMRARTKGIIMPEKNEPHEVKRITKSMTLVQQSYYKSGKDRPTVYMSKILEETLIAKDNRIATGEVVITQNELIETIFKPLLNNEEFALTNSHYLITAMLEYQRSLCDQDLKIDIDIQVMWLHYIIEHGEFQYLQMVQQYAILPDAVEIANEFYYAAKNGCWIAWQLAVDTYHRLSLYREVIKIMLERDKVEDVTNYIEKYHIKGTRAKEILEAVHRLPEKEKNLYIGYFAKARVI